jgi:maltose O-acetyltransferase
MIVARCDMEIGANSILGEDVSIYDHNHCYSDLTIPFRDQEFCGRHISIGKNVWIGCKVFIGPGVTIGDNVVIGACTVITKSIPPNTIVYSKTTLTMRPLPTEDAHDAPASIWRDVSEEEHGQ